jgi:multidrug resistance efflux pump
MLEHYEFAPWTRDDRVRADIVAVARDVSGLIAEVFVKDKQPVGKGDVMLRLDSRRFRLAVRQAEAIAASREAAVDRTANDRIRYEKLSEGIVSQQQQEQVRATDLQAKTAYSQALADLDGAKLNLAGPKFARNWTPPSIRYRQCRQHEYPSVSACIPTNGWDHNPGVFGQMLDVSRIQQWHVGRNH